MKRRNLPVDLSLVRLFLTIWDLRSLTAAGHQLGLTQPRASHLLARLRNRLGDALFVRGDGGMIPTEAAIRLHGPLRQAFDIISRALNEHASFDPATAERAFRIAMSDVSEFYYLPPLLAQLGQMAPSVRLETFQIPSDAIPVALRTGEVDLALGYLGRLEVGYISHRLFTDRFVCLVRAGHPVEGDTLTREKLATLRFVYADTNASGNHLIEQALADLGIRRQVALRAAHLTVAPEVVRNTDLAVLIPLSMARRINQPGVFRLLDLPFDLPDIEVGIHAHGHFANDEGIIWLRDMISAMLTSGPDGYCLPMADG